MSPLATAPQQRDPQIGLATVPPPDPAEVEHDDTTTSHGDGGPPDPPVTGRIAYGPRPPRRRWRWQKVLFLLVMMVFCSIVGWIIGAGFAYEWRLRTGEPF